MKRLSLLLLFLAACAAPPGARAPRGAPAPAPRQAPDLEDMALVPGGEFLMGSPEGAGRGDERPARRVLLDPFYMDKFEVTGAQFAAFAAATGREVRRQPCPEADRCPAVYVNWFDALAYCEFNAKRLPTEAEWERAARGGSGGAFAHGDDPAGLGEYAWYWDNSGRKVRPVGGRRPNAYGLYDMHGNVLEWTADWYDAAYYAGGPARNPAGPPSGSEKVVRGGSAFATAEMCRSAARMTSSPHTPYSGRGFRCAASAAGAVP